MPFFFFKQSRPLDSINLRQIRLNPAGNLLKPQNDSKLSPFVTAIEKMCICVSVVTPGHLIAKVLQEEHFCCQLEANRIAAQAVRLMIVSIYCAINYILL